MNPVGRIPNEMKKAKHCDKCDRVVRRRNTTGLCSRCNLEKRTAICCAKEIYAEFKELRDRLKKNNDGCLRYLLKNQKGGST